MASRPHRNDERAAPAPSSPFPAPQRPRLAVRHDRPDAPRVPAEAGPTLQFDPRPHGASWLVRASRTVEYQVRLAPGLFDVDNDTLEAWAFAPPLRRRLLVVEERVLALHGPAIRRYLARRDLPGTVLGVRVSEATKNVEHALVIARAIDGHGLDRRGEPVIAVGGGVLLDVVGWVASMYRRGTPYIRVPTTLLGVVDAGVGVKTGVNHNGNKNGLGSYHAPQIALLDRTLLRTLPRRHVANGLAEVAKMGLMSDPELWRLLSSYGERLLDAYRGGGSQHLTDVGDEVIVRSVHSMLTELYDNLWETRLERLVDFGHTFSPALEMAALPKLLHGEAVAVDMALSSAIAHGRGLVSSPQLQEILATFRRLGLPVAHPVCDADLAARALEGTVRHRGGRQRAPVPAGIGSGCFLDDIGEAELRRGVQYVREWERRHAGG